MRKLITIDNNAYLNILTVTYVISKIILKNMKGTMKKQRRGKIDIIDIRAVNYFFSGLRK